MTMLTNILATFTVEKLNIHNSDNWIKCHVSEPGPQLVVEPPAQGLFPLSVIKDWIEQ